MKKLFIVAFALLVASKVSAQKGPSFGIKGGLSFSNIIKTDDSNFKTNYQTGFNAGAFLTIPIVDRLAFQPELMFSQKGYKSDRSGILGSGTLTQTTNWIEIPILAKVEAAKGFSIYLGPEVSFLTKTTNKYDGTFSSSQKTTYESDADKFKKSILGGVLGVGIDLSNKLSLNGRYALDFQKNNEDGTTSTPAFKNQVWQVGLGIKF
ncbi:MAG: PorT family protein [Bacteroidetes bacterium]|nr:PorT family protein [Bacteroidota bacterium]MBU1372812.1 PorT family protein [Bacteroidota bacterium]MBU1485541.1 PorT family protein [Bacteroidota bacterium]MBU1760080.1 PorT family protein [Bacteroidota bacterium]MBU2045415.1 PorT family protein [Bacteroidota bacterium]